MLLSLLNAIQQGVYYIHLGDIENSRLSASHVKYFVKTCTINKPLYSSLVISIVCVKGSTFPSCQMRRERYGSAMINFERTITLNGQILIPRRSLDSRLSVKKPSHFPRYIKTPRTLAHRRGSCARIVALVKTLPGGFTINEAYGVVFKLFVIEKLSRNQAMLFVFIEKCRVRLKCCSFFWRLHPPVGDFYSVP